MALVSDKPFTDDDSPLSNLVRTARKVYQDDTIVAAVIVAAAIENMRERIAGKIDDLIEALDAQTPPDWRAPKKQADQYTDGSGVQRPRT